jgi:hypothetical protein
MQRLLTPFRRDIRKKTTGISHAQPISQPVRESIAKLSGHASEKVSLSIEGILAVCVPMPWVVVALLPHKKLVNLWLASDAFSSALSSLAQILYMLYHKIQQLQAFGCLQRSRQ